MVKEIRTQILRGHGNWVDVLIPVSAVIAGLVVGAILIIAIGKSPLEAGGALLRAAFYGKGNFGETLVTITPLICTGLSVAVAFRCGLFNIGGEGQWLVAQVAAAWVGYSITGLPWLLHLPLAILAGTLAGGIWGAIPGVLKAYRGVHEVVNTIMLNYIALYGSQLLLARYMKEPGQLPVSHPVLESARLYQFLPPSRLHTGLFLALLAAVVVYWILWRTVLGYEIRAVGLSPGAAEYGGVRVGRQMAMAMLIAGALAGLGGTVQVLGVQGKFFDPFGFSGYGFDGIAVALLGRNHPFGVVVAAVLFGILERGGPSMQAIAGVPKAITQIVQASVIFFVAADGVIRAVLARRAERARIRSNGNGTGGEEVAG